MMITIATDDCYRDRENEAASGDRGGGGAILPLLAPHPAVDGYTATVAPPMLLPFPGIRAARASSAALARHASLARTHARPAAW